MNMKKQGCLLLFLFLTVCLACGCEQVKVGPAVPEDVEAEMAAARAAYDELMKLNPPSTMTFHYRTAMKEAEDALAAGKYSKAAEAARKAKEQADLARDAHLQRLLKVRKELDAIKLDLESMYLPPGMLINSYWDARDALRAYDYDTSIRIVEELKFKIQQEKTMSFAESRTLTVMASEEYISRWGNVRVYKEITTDGKLREVIATVGPNTDVYFVRTSLFARGKTFYLVEIPGIGIQGWMAEQYVAPERVKVR